MLGGKNVHELGVCPASVDASYEGLNGGKKAGRICWAVAGTFCGRKKQGTFADKLITCMSCEFFKLVKKETTVHFRLMKPK